MVFFYIRVKKIMFNIEILTWNVSLQIYSIISLLNQDRKSTFLIKTAFFSWVCETSGKNMRIIFPIQNFSMKHNFFAWEIHLKFFPNYIGRKFSQNIWFDDSPFPYLKIVPNQELSTLQMVTKYWSWQSKLSWEPHLKFVYLPKLWWHQLKIVSKEVKEFQDIIYISYMEVSSSCTLGSFFLKFLTPPFVATFTL